MKTTLIYGIFLLFTISLEAQSFKATLTKKVDTINSILEKEKMVRFTNLNSDVFYPTKINANLQGNVFCVDSITNDNVALERIMFNLMKVNSLVISGNEIKALGQNKKPIVAIFIGDNQNRNALKKELDALRYICVSYSKQNPKYKCE